MSNNTQNMQIYTIIGQLEDMLEHSPKPKLSSGGNKRVIDVDEMMDLLGDLKVTIPEDIRRANSVMIESQTTIENAEDHAREVVADAQSEAERIVAQAQATAGGIVDKAKQEYERLVLEDEIYQEAQRRAQLLAKKAEANASLVYENAKCYADDVLRDLESFLGEYKQLVAINRKDLDARRAAAPQPVPAAQPQNPAAPAAAAPQEDAAPQPAPAPESAPQPRRKPKPAQADGDGDDFADDVFEDDEDQVKGGFLSGLFKRKKKNSDIDFDDDDFDDEDDR